MLLFWGWCIFSLLLALVIHVLLGGLRRTIVVIALSTWVRLWCGWIWIVLCSGPDRSSIGVSYRADVIFGCLCLARRLIPQTFQDTAVLRRGSMRLVHYIVITREGFPSFVQEISFSCTLFLRMLSVLIRLLQIRGVLLIPISFFLLVWRLSCGDGFHLGELLATVY